MKGLEIEQYTDGHAVVFQPVIEQGAPVFENGLMLKEVAHRGDLGSCVRRVAWEGLRSSSKKSPRLLIFNPRITIHFDEIRSNKWLKDSHNKVLLVKNL